RLASGADSAAKTGRRDMGAWNAMDRMENPYALLMKPLPASMPACPKFAPVRLKKHEIAGGGSRTPYC
ncbi:MAG: hypothetical protein ACTS5Y_12570, partial [Pollutimonas bauzanensis]